MKNKTTILLTIAILLTVGLGCSYTDNLTNSGASSNDNRAADEKAIDMTLAEQKIDVPECDELFTALSAFMNSPEDDFVTKAARRVAYNKVRDGIKQSIEKNQTDKAQLAKDCREYKTMLDNFQNLQ